MYLRESELEALQTLSTRTYNVVLPSENGNGK